MPRKIPWLVIIIGAYLVLGTLYAVLTPNWQIPDEPAHYNFIRYVAQNQALPELTMGCYDEAYLNQLKAEKFSAHHMIDTVCYENYQPPLYYTLAAPIFTLTGGNLTVLRLLSVGFGALALAIIYQTVGLFLPNTIFPPAATAYAAFVPMHLTMTAAVNNDALAELLFVTLIYVLLRWLLNQSPFANSPAPILAGGILGLILITKVTVYTAVPLAGIILLLANRNLSALLRNGLRIYLPALVISLPMFVRNSVVYGWPDILGLARHDLVVVGQLRTVDRLAEIGLWRYLNDLFRTTFHSFWGQFGWMAVPMDGRVYLALTILQVLALVGLILWLWNLRSNSLTKPVAQSLLVMALALTLVSGVFVGLNLSFVQFQGRYFFSGLMPLGIFFSLGLAEISRRRYALRVAALLLLLLVGLAVASLNGGGLDKWAVLICGAATGGFAVRHWLPENLSGWFVGACYAALATLSGVSLWWFIIPNL